jgi:hypothetical protein
MRKAVRQKINYEKTHFLQDDVRQEDLGGHGGER